MSEACVWRALALLEKAGRMDLVREEALGPLRPARELCGSDGGRYAVYCGDDALLAEERSSIFNVQKRSVLQGAGRREGVRALLENSEVSGFGQLGAQALPTAFLKE
ncbi:hypothetical protein NDU88_011154 [Pleurodeles waltl]|uniref:Uncharacterized protein n=1 Tax=Pleurodeles waltl TaxID=8319 RepID=A0AAV7R2K2_PLEWA|nr:hypothetical protein NDU88_011154 [Pleurodeles waltl]